jgi:hypothetical protein
MDLPSKTFSLSAVIHSDRLEHTSGSFTVAMYESPNEYPRYRSRAAVSSSLPMAMAAPMTKSSSESALTSKPLLFNIGEAVIGSSFRTQLKSFQVYFEPRNFIDLDMWSDANEGPAVKGYFFVTPFHFPSSDMIIRQEHYVSETRTRGHQIDELVIVKLHNSDTLRYKAYITNVITSQSTGSVKTAPTVHKVNIHIMIEKLSKNSEMAMITFPISNMAIKSVSIPPTDDLERPGFLSWLATINNPKTEMKIEIIYEE